MEAFNFAYSLLNALFLLSFKDLSIFFVVLILIVPSSYEALTTLIIAFTFHPWPIFFSF